MTSVIVDSLDCELPPDRQVLNLSMIMDCCYANLLSIATISIVFIYYHALTVAMHKRVTQVMMENPMTSVTVDSPLVLIK